MEKLITNDLFNISSRLKKIEREYAIFYHKNNYYAKFKNQFAFSIGTKLDCLALKRALYTHIRRKKSILLEVSQNNKKFKEKEELELKNKNIFDLKQKLVFADKRGGVVNFEKANTTRWI